MRDVQQWAVSDCASGKRGNPRDILSGKMKDFVSFKIYIFKLAEKVSLIFIL